MTNNDTAGSASSSWRYQAVYEENAGANGDISYLFSVCEVYLDEGGRLEAWTENSSIAASGETLDELTHDLRYMLGDIAQWEPVLFESLQVGMIFKPKS